MRSLLAASFGLLLLCLPLGLQARTDEIIQEVTAHGTTREDSLANALAEAARQLFGATISTAEARASLTVETTSDKGGTFDSADATARRISIKTPGGTLNSYRILSQEKDPDQPGFRTTVEVRALKFAGTTGGGSEKRLKVAVMPPRLGKASFPVGTGTLPAEEIARQWNQAMISEFVQSRKFAVLDRDFIAETLREHHFIASDQVPLSEQVKLGQALGADFLIVGVLTDFAQTDKPYTMQLTGQTVIKRALRMNFEYRVIDIATKEIRTSDSLQREWTPQDIKDIAKDSGETYLMAGALKAGAKLIADNVIDVIYPLMVVKATGPTQITLNQGGIRVEVGQRYELFAAGEKLVDPQTGESLGAEETLAGVIEITRVNPKISTAKLIEGTLVGIAPGAICRRPQGPGAQTKAPAPEKPAAAPVERFSFPGSK